MPSDPSGQSEESVPAGPPAEQPAAGPPTSGPPAGSPTSGPPGSARPGRPSLATWPVLLTGLGAAALVAVMVAVIGLVATLGGRGGQVAEAEGLWQPPVPRPAEPVTTPADPQPTEPTISLSATGDIILGDAGRLPPGDGAGFFDDVAEALAADLVMGNLEQPLTDDTGYQKCPEDSTACHAFRAPPHYAAHLAEAGFALMNLANNHGDDYGPQGRANTQAALTAHDIAYTGERDQITVVEVGTVAVAVVGFSPYAWTNDLNDHQQAAAVVSRAAQQADLVVVQVHMGAEGSDQTRVRPGPEDFFGENRGDPMAFSRAVIDAGADLVIGHGPHVLRGLEFYRGRLIAYSLGNFCGYRALSSRGYSGVGAVLKVTLNRDGTWVAGQLIATEMVGPGTPAIDTDLRALAFADNLSVQNFGDAGARVDHQTGKITVPVS